MNYGFSFNPDQSQQLVSLTWGGLIGQTYAPLVTDGWIWGVQKISGWWSPSPNSTREVDAPSGDGKLALDPRLGVRPVTIEGFVQVEDRQAVGILEQALDALAAVRSGVLVVRELKRGVSREADCRLMDMQVTKVSDRLAKVTLSLQADDPLRYSSVAISSAESVEGLEARGLRVNLATNPSFERAVSQVVRTNLATNPSFEASAGGTVTVPTGPAALRVASFNVLNQRYADLRDDVAPWAVRVRRIAEAIVSTGAVIVGLQELQAWVFDSHLADILRELDRIEPGVWAGSDGANYNGIVWRRSAVERVSVVTSVIVNPNFPESQGNRLLSWAVFQHRVTGAEFIFSVTHFGDTASRPESCQVAADTLDAASAANGGIPVVLTGDFNDPFTTDTSVYGRMAARGYVNSRSLAVSVTNGGLNSFNDLDPLMVGYQNGNWIDGILVKGLSVVPEVGVTASFADGTGLPLETPLASDHLPIYADVALPSQDRTFPDVRQQGAQVAVTAGGAAVCYQSRAWSDRGDVSLCVAPGPTATTATSVYIAGTGQTLAKLGVVPGKTYTVSATIYLQREQSGTLGNLARSIVVDIPRSDGSTTWTFAKSDPAPNAPGVHRLTTTFTVPNDATGVNIRLTNGSTTTPVWYDSFVVEETSKDKGPLDGDMGDISGLYIAWAGEPNNSVTQMTASTPVAEGTGGTAMPAGGGALLFQVFGSYLPPVAGNYTLRIDPRYAGSNETSAFVAGIGGAMSRLGFEPGGTYTVSATIILTSPQSGLLSALARRIVVGVEMANARNHWEYALSEQAPNEPGRHRVSVTFTVPKGASNCLVRLMNGSSETVVWWDALLVERGDQVGEYFDGDSPGAVWLGPANQAQSVLASASGVTGGSAPITDGAVFLPNRGDARAYPLLEVTYPSGDLTITHPGGTWKLDGWSSAAKRFVDCRNGDVFNAAGNRLFGIASGSWPYIDPGGSTWQVSGASAGCTVTRSEAWT
ncbi:endonuclease/exonuclease/phosphatase family protein [Actinomycetaceae bacterium MB13-C1-2]|nr:endonuclease/exonuclease/phosphatase family protein [Actinomycetaceae bacterium MB13-C1-2]